MRKFIRILIPLLLVISIILCLYWYLFIYDRDFTKDMLLSCARRAEAQGNHTVATWFYDTAYRNISDNDSVACELAEQYKENGNYTKAEFTLSNALADGGGVDLYIALCKTYVEQDKLLDAVNMLNGVKNPEIKEQLDAIRPAAPTAVPEPGFYNQYISVTLETEAGQIYVNPNGEYPCTIDGAYTDAIALADGENKIYAVTVAENGLVSPLAVYVYTVGGVVELMQFSDPAIETAVREKLNMPEPTELYTNDLWTITDFTVPADAEVYADLRHFAFLETLNIESGVAQELKNITSLSNLKTLTVKNTSMSQDDLQYIASLPALKTLTLANCSLGNISALEKAVGITTLDLNNNTIRDLTPLGALSQLTALNVEHNAVESLSGLSGNTALTSLDISYNAISSLSPICGLTSLKVLLADNNSITELGDFSQLQALTKLSLKSNQLADVAPIAVCANLSDLNISTNKITDINALSDLSKLCYLDFSYNTVTELPVFQKDCALVTIDGTSNQISTLENLSGLENLNNVNMDYNTEISSVEPLSKCHLLIEVNVYATKVTDVTPLTNQSIIVNYNPVQTAN